MVEVTVHEVDRSLRIAEKFDYLWHRLVASAGDLSCEAVLALEEPGGAERGFLAVAGWEDQLD
jgi:hypothetical protein